MIYACDSCKFVFEHVGEVDRCPDCGKKTFGKPAMKKSKNTLNIKKKRINIFYKEKAFRTGHRNAFSLYRAIFTCFFIQRRSD